MTITQNQFISLALVPKFTSALSLLGSLWIVLDVIGDKEKRSLVFHRLMLALSCLDMMVSFVGFLSTWPIPASTGLYLASGNEATCNFQGFVVQLNSAVFLYSAMMTIYFVLVIRCQMREKPDLQKREPLLHLIPLGFGLGTAITCLAKGWLGPAGVWCWIAGFDEAYIYRWAFFYAPMWLCFLVISLGMGSIYWSVRATEQESNRHDAALNAMRSSLAKATSSEMPSDADGDNNAISTREQLRKEKKRLREMQLKKTKRTRQVAVQASLYVVAFYVTAIFATINRVYQQVSDGQSLYALLLLQVFFSPLQGFFNFLIYRRKYVLRLWKTKGKEMTWGQFIVASLELNLLKGCCNCCPVSGRRRRTSLLARKAALSKFSSSATGVITVESSGRVATVGGDSEVRRDVVVSEVPPPAIVEGNVSADLEEANDNNTMMDFSSNQIEEDDDTEEMVATGIGLTQMERFALHLATTASEVSPGEEYDDAYGENGGSASKVTG